MAGHDPEVGDGPGCEDALADGLGWGLGMILRAYVKDAPAALAPLPRGRRGSRSFQPPLRASLAASSPSPSTLESNRYRMGLAGRPAPDADPDLRCCRRGFGLQ
jgi:hypothetical protein